MLAADALLEAHAQDWLVREIRLYLRRVFKRIDMTARSLITLIEAGSCFAGTLAELVFAADRAVMFADAAGPRLQLGRMNFGAYAMGNGLTRLQTRFVGEPASVARARGRDRARAGRRRTRRNWASSPPFMIRWTGTTSCACCSRSGRVSRPMR